MRAALVAVAFAWIAGCAAAPADPARPGFESGGLSLLAPGPEAGFNLTQPGLGWLAVHASADVP